MKRAPVKTVPVFTGHERFFSKIKINKDNDCWDWVSNIGKSGYGSFGVKKATFTAHRVSWSIFVGDVKKDMVLDHLCSNRKCVNPDHLREVTHRENLMASSLTMASINSSKTKCKRGHALEGENIYKTSKGGRQCVQCRRGADRNRYWENPDKYRKMKSEQHKNKRKIKT